MATKTECPNCGHEVISQNKSKYRWLDIEIGESFVLDANGKDSAKSMVSAANRRLKPLRFKLGVKTDKFLILDKSSN